MTEREQKARAPQPTNRDIQRAIEGLAQAYHEFVQALMAREDDERRERRMVRERLDQLFGQIDAFQRKVDRQFDIRDREFDTFKAETERRLAALEGTGDDPA